MPKLIIIDGHSLLYRAFFAVPPLSTRDGTPTNAVYGFLRMLLKLWREERPDYLVIAFDAPTPTFRHQQFADYKAQRAKAPDAFRPQVGLLRQILKTVGIAFWELDGYEADDLMATAVAQARPMDVQVVLVTGDMDALQLVGDGVVALMPKRGISEMERYDAERVLQEFGVPPERIPDLKGLAGDNSDNLPGVPGIGEKTARELLGEFGSLEGVLENAAKIPKPQVRENLLRFADQARQCKTLATLKSDAPINLNLDELSVHRWRWRSPEVAELLMRLEMRTLLEELGLTELLAEEASVKGMVIKDEAAWTEALQAIRQQGRVAFALDGTERQPKGVALAWKGAVAYLPLAPSTEFAETASLFAGEKERAEANARGQTLPDGQQWLLTLLTDVTLIKSAHHWKRLLKALGPIAIERCGMTPRGFEDAELLAYLLNPSQGDYAWKPLAMERRLPTKFHITWEGDETAPTDACEEALTVAELAPLLVNEVREAGMWELWERIEMPLIFVLADMERHGVLVDVGYLRQLGKEMQRMAKQLEEQVYRLAGVRFNLRSPQQLAEVLFRRLRLPMPKRMTGGRLSTAAPILEALAKEHEIARLILQFRELEKLRGTFVEGLLTAADEQGRVHTTYDQTGTADLIKAAMVAIWRSLKERGLDAKMTMQVHDELVLEVAERQVMVVAKLVKQRMETVLPLRVPLVVEVKVGDNWAEMERIL